MFRFAAAMMTCILAGTAVGAAEPGRSDWVYLGQDRKLVYRETERGDRIMDFSFAGYEGGGVALPDVAGTKVVKPTGADDTKAIQAAIDEASARDLRNGFRGVVELAAGTFACEGMISISADGVVLRGAGSGEGGTVIKLIGRPHPAFRIGRSGERGRRDEASVGGTVITDEYVPSGASSFRVKDPGGLKAGDWVAVRKPVTEAWVKFMGMDDMVRDGKPQTWLKTGAVVNSERRIKSIEGDRVTVEVPLSDSYDSKYLNPPGVTVEEIPPPAEVRHVGVERVRVVCPEQAINHTEAHFTGMRISGQDCWVRDVVFEETMNTVGVSGRRITLQNVSVVRKAPHQGSSKPAEFAPNGTQVLLDRCKVDAENVWFVATGMGVSGPIVLLNCEFKGSGDAEAHQRWSTGILYDNCTVERGGITLRNRGSMGSGHGWAMGWGVVWNCVANHYIVQNPPGALNWLIGSTGDNRLAPRPFGDGPMLAEGVVDSPGQRVEPSSLYLAQLRERLGPGALAHIGYGPAK